MEVSIHSFGADNKAVLAIFKLLMPTVARDERDNPEKQNALTLLRKLSGRKNELNCLIQLFDELNAVDEVKENLFQQLQLFVQVKPMSWLPLQHRNFPLQKIQFTSSVQKHFSVGEQFKNGSISKIKINTAQQQPLCSYTKNVLMTLLRESDPVTYALPQSTQLFDCGHGTTVAMFSMEIKKRLAVESYIGYVAFKNNLPLAYGGAWITGTHARIGINIFPWFRGGESARTMAQLMHVYHTHTGVKTFSVEPYQIGKGNSDAIKSGAFWFYYRLGFRCMQNDLQLLAESEWKKINADKTYRSNLATLNQLANANLVFHIGNDEPQIISSKEISEYIQKAITKKFDGNICVAKSAGKTKLKKIFGDALTNLNPDEKFWIDEFAILIACMPDMNDLKSADKKKLMQLLLSKASVDESEFVKQWQKNMAWN